MANFVVDETCWQVAELSAPAYVEHIEEILDTIDDLIEARHSCLYSDELFTIKLVQELTFYDLYDPAAPIPISREIQQRVAATFGRLKAWQDLESSWPSCFEVSIEGGTEELACSIAWAHARALEGALEAVPCIVHRSRRPQGLIPVRVGDSAVDIWMISTSSQTQSYFRWLILKATYSPEEMAAFAADAFPELNFVPGAFNGIKSMSKPYRNLTDDIVAHLSVLSDHGKRIFGNNWHYAPAEFGSLKVDASDENGNTKNNAVAQRERTCKFRNRNIICWWHTKLQPDRDRIHFCPDQVPTGGGIVVGVFSRHLTT